MNMPFDSEVEKRIRAAVKPGDPCAVNELLEELSLDDDDRTNVAEIVADEYRRRLKAMPREQMLELYRLFYEDANDANKDWLLGEVVEGIEAERN
jgi:hypothetical protein